MEAKYLNLNDYLFESVYKCVLEMYMLYILLNAFEFSML